MAGPLTDRLLLEPLGDGVWTRTCDDVWWGHGALFGGYAQALALAAMQAELDTPEMPLRSISMQFLRPFLEGAFRAEVVLERKGRNLANLSCRCHSVDRLAGVAIANFGTTRACPTFFAARPPAVDPVGDDEAPVEQMLGVPTHRRFGFHPRMEQLDRLHPEGAVSGGWVRLPPGERLDAAMCVMLADLWTPAAHRRWVDDGVPAMAVSADITVHIHTDLPAAEPDEPVFVWLRAHQSAHGYADEDGEIWTADGALVATSRQVRFVTALDPGGS